MIFFLYVTHLATMWALIYFKNIFQKIYSYKNEENYINNKKYFYNYSTTHCASQTKIIKCQSHYSIVIKKNDHALAFAYSSVLIKKIFKHTLHRTIHINFPFLLSQNITRSLESSLSQKMWFYCITHMHAYMHHMTILGFCLSRVPVRLRLHQTYIITHGMCVYACCY